MRAAEHRVTRAKDPPRRRKNAGTGAAERVMIANGSAQHRVLRLQCIQHRALRNGRRLTSSSLASTCANVRRCAGSTTLNHGSVCTSTDSTAGRSRTIGAQVSPASADAYTCPPVVPK